MDPKMSARILVFFYIFTSVTATFVKLTNLKCKEFDPPFAVFKQCYLKLKTRNTVGMNIYVKVFKIPVANVTVSFCPNLNCNGFKTIESLKSLFFFFTNFPDKFRISQKGQWLQTFSV